MKSRSIGGYYTWSMRHLFIALLLVAGSASAQEPPAWFAHSLLFMADEVADATKDGKRVMLYFGQEGCPYCKQLMEVNFRQRATVERMQKHFVAIELNIWGDREVTWLDGKAMSEKQLAAQLKVQFTPTLLFLDEKGAIALRVNGYYQPQRLDAALDFASGRISHAQFLKASPSAKERLNEQPFFTTPSGKKPRALLFETTHCADCDALHREIFTRPEVLEQLRRFDVARFAASGKEARALKVEQVPTLVLTDARGREALRLEAYFRPFHVAGALEYVSSGAYRKEPSFQRFLQEKADGMRAGGTPVDLWK